MIKQILLLTSVTCIIALAFILRIIFIPSSALSFHYDMSRDAFEAQKIIKDGDLKILGPPTSTPGLFHGPLYYYLIAPFYGRDQVGLLGVDVLPKVDAPLEKSFFIIEPHEGIPALPKRNE